MLEAVFSWTNYILHHTAAALSGGLLLVNHTPKVSCPNETLALKKHVTSSDFYWHKCDSH